MATSRSTRLPPLDDPHRKARTPHGRLHGHPGGDAPHPPEPGGRQRRRPHHRSALFVGRHVPRRPRHVHDRQQVHAERAARHASRLRRGQPRPALMGLLDGALAFRMRPHRQAWRLPPVLRGLAAALHADRRLPGRRGRLARPRAVGQGRRSQGTAYRLLPPPVRVHRLGIGRGASQVRPRRAVVRLPALPRQAATSSIRPASPSS